MTRVWGLCGKSRHDVIAGLWWKAVVAYRYRWGADMVKCLEESFPKVDKAPYTSSLVD